MRKELRAPTLEPLHRLWLQTFRDAGAPPATSALARRQRRQQPRPRGEDLLELLRWEGEGGQ